MSKKKSTKKKTASRTKKRKTKAELAQEEERKQWITFVILCALTIAAYMKMGIVGEFLYNVQRFLFGEYSIIFMIVMVLQVSITIVNAKSGNTASQNPLAIVLVIAALSLLFAAKGTDHSLRGIAILKNFLHNPKSFFVAPYKETAGGGLIGAVLLTALTPLLDYNGTYMVIAVLFIITLILMVSLDVYKSAFHTIREYFSTVEFVRDDEDDEEEEPEEDEQDDYYEEVVYKEPVREPAPAALPAEKPVEKVPVQQPAPVTQEAKEQPMETPAYGGASFSPLPKQTRPIGKISLEATRELNMEPFMDPYFSNKPYVEPAVRSPLNIHADGEATSEDVVTVTQPRTITPEEMNRIVAQTWTDEPSSASVFLNVDDLFDQYNAPQAQTPVSPEAAESVPTADLQSVIAQRMEEEHLPEGEETVPEDDEDLLGKDPIYTGENSFGGYEALEPPFEQEPYFEEEPFEEEDEPEEAPFDPMSYRMPTSYASVDSVPPYREKEEEILPEVHTPVPQHSAVPPIRPSAPTAVPTTSPSAVQPVKSADAVSDNPALPANIKERIRLYYQLPSGNVLDPVPPRSGDDPNVAAAKEKGELLIQVLQNFDIKAELIDTHIGPAVTKFEIRPEVGVKVSKILSLTDDIKMMLAVRDVRIEAPIPGRYAVGIEIPNIKSTAVKMRELAQKVSEEDARQPMLFYLGKDLLGNAVSCRLDKMPHLLIAGATGSGKSVCMNAIITSFLLRTKPDEVKLLLVDPKKVEFTPYQKVPHLIGPVINDPMQANAALKVIVKIMDERYDLFSRNSVRNIQGYNSKVRSGEITRPDAAGNQVPAEVMPYIVVIIDELADLMVVAGKEVESSIQRITQLARAAGIHLIVATQRPSADVITGVIKANIPSRIAFSVSSSIDSRVILDHVGAERLLGNGDMLYMPIGESNALRVQGVYVTDDEVQRISDFVSNQSVPPMYDDAFVRLDGVEGNAENAVVGADEDPLYTEVREYVIEAQKASTSLLQRRFGIGYNRAARMIDLLESKGIIGPAQGSKPRDVYIRKGEQIDEEQDF